MSFSDRARKLPEYPTGREPVPERREPIFGADAPLPPIISAFAPADRRGAPGLCRLPSRDAWKFDVAGL